MRRKRILTVLLLTALLLPTAACTPQPAEAPFSVRCGEAELSLGMPLDNAAALLGDTGTRQTAESCAGTGWDVLVTFPSLYLYGFAPVGGEATLTGVWLTDDAASCAGVKIGTGEAEVRAFLGEPTEESAERLIYVRGQEALTLTLRDGRVTSVYLTVTD